MEKPREIWREIVVDGYDQYTFHRCITLPKNENVIFKTLNTVTNKMFSEIICYTILYSAHQPSYGKYLSIRTNVTKV